MFTLAELWSFMLTVKWLLENWGTYLLYGVMIAIVIHMVFAVTTPMSRRMANASSFCRWAVVVWTYAINPEDLYETSKKLFIGFIGLVELIFIILRFVICIVLGLLLYTVGIDTHPDAFMGWSRATTTVISHAENWGFMTDAQFVKQVNALVKLLDEVKKKRAAPAQPAANKK